MNIPLNAKDENPGRKAITQMVKALPIIETIDKNMFVMMENIAEAAIESVNSNRIMPTPLQTILILEGLGLTYEDAFVALLRTLL